MIDNTPSRRSRIDTIVPRLNEACCIITAVKPFLSQETLKDDFLCLFSLGNELQTVILGKLLTWHGSF
jgi:hypothetical protein